jgi:hypothetical protein
MLGSYGNEVVHDGHIDLSFSESDKWPRQTAALPDFQMPKQAYTGVVLGDPVVGPALELATSEPADERGFWPTHWHATDSFRVSLRGELVVLPGTYGPGEFFFLEAGKYYNQGFSLNSPEGQWTCVVLGDKRGLPGKRAKPDTTGDFVEAYVEASPGFSMIESHPELVPEVHPKGSEGTPGLVTTLGPLKGGRLDGSFADYQSWTPTGDGVWLAGALLADPTAGPVMLVSHTEPGAMAMPATTFATEVCRTVVRGSGTVGEDLLSWGAVRIQEAGSPHPAVVAGPDGLDEVIVLGDRRSAWPTDTDESHSWIRLFTSILGELGVLTSAG